MQSHGESTTSVILEDVTVYVAIELSAKSWVVGLKTPGSDKIGLHVLKPSDACGLGALIERYREDASERVGSAARVLVAMKRVSKAFGWPAFWMGKVSKRLSWTRRAFL